MMAMPGISQAKVTGACSGCHTMHNSQGGSPMAYRLSGSSFSFTGTPNENLLVTDCLGCHTATDGNTWKNDMGAPIVYNTSAPSYGAQGLAAGNFYWVTQDDAYGHNIFSSDATLINAPGSIAENICGSTSCHKDLSQPSVGVGGSLAGKAACEGCHLAPAHHAHDTGPVVDNDPEGEGWYRFLSGHDFVGDVGVTGIEDDDWQYSRAKNDHNEYLGNEALTALFGFNNLGNTVTAFCCGCHGNFHEQTDTGYWIRHPSDAKIPNEGEYANAFQSGTTYDPLVPVARPDLGGGVRGDVELDADMVMCLSCHRAHASPYYKMMRWDYKNWPDPGAGTNGCNECHTWKD
jgi:hypothetical protein